MRADKTLLLKQKEANLCSLFDQLGEDALDGKVLNYNNMINIFEELKDIISEYKKTDVKSFNLKIEIQI